MYYAKYLKYKNKYLNLKYQLGGTLTSQLVRRIEVKKPDSTIPEVSTALEREEQLRPLLENNLVGIRVVKSNSKVLIPLVNYNKKFRSNPINFYEYIDKSSDRPEPYILCSLYNYYEILFELQKKNIKIRRINIDEKGNVTLKLKDITIPASSENFIKSDVKKKLMENLVGIKVLQSNSSLLKPLIKDKEFKKFAIKNKIHYYTYTDEDGSYILCSLYDYYEFLDILYEHIEIEEVEIEEKEEKVVITELPKIYHIIHKPVSMRNQSITLPLKINTFETPAILIDALKSDPFIIIDKQDNTSELLLQEVCMYNLFIGTIHVFVIFINSEPSRYFLLSLYTEYELKQYIGTLSYNINIKECRLYKQGDRIDFKLNEEFVGMMFNIYDRLRNEGHYANRLYRGNPAIDNLFLNQLDATLLEKCEECISVKDIAFNTTLCLLPDKIEAKDHKDILEMEKDFLKNKFELINSNEKLYLWRYKYEDLIQLWEYSLEDLEKEVEKFKNELLGLEPCHKELLVLKLNEKGFEGDTMDNILKNNVLCYLNDGDENKRLVFENTNQIDPLNNHFVKNLKYNPEMKRLLETNPNPESELHKYRQTVLMLVDGNEFKENPYVRNQKYFFARSFFAIERDDKAYDILSWSFKLNKLCIQCLVFKDIIFPFRIIKLEKLMSPLSPVINVNNQEFCGFLHTNFIDNYDGTKNFSEECRDKFYFIYKHRTDSTIEAISRKKYTLFYYTGNTIWINVSILPYYRIYVCEINWIYYTFILKYNKIPYFYEYTNDEGKKEILVSIFSLEEIEIIYNEKCFDTLELKLLKKVYYNHNYYRRVDITDTIFVNNPLLKTDEEIEKFINNVLLKNKIII
jgi:hypothetical protein